MKKMIADMSSPEKLRPIYDLIQKLDLKQEKTEHEIIKVRNLRRFVSLFHNHVYCPLQKRELFDAIAGRFGITNEQYQNYLMQMNLSWGQSGNLRLPDWMGQKDPSIENVIDDIIEQNIENIVEEFERTKARMRSYGKWSDALTNNEASISSIFPSLYPEKTTTINDFLIDEIGVPDRVLEFNIYLNGKEIDASKWNIYQIDPNDEISIFPSDFALKSHVDMIHGLMYREINNKNEIYEQDSIRELLRSDVRFKENDIEFLYNYYERLTTKLYSKGNGVKGTQSPKVVPLKFLIGESIHILNEFNILGKVADDKDLSQIIRWSDTTYSKYSLRQHLFKRYVEGDRFSIGNPQDLLCAWFSGLYNSILDSSISNSQKKQVNRILDRLMMCGFNIFEGRKENALYLQIRMRFEMVRNIIKQEDDKKPQSQKILKDDSHQEYEDFIEYHPHFSKWKDKPSYNFKLRNWEDCGNNILQKLDIAGYISIIQKVENIWSEIETVIKDYSQVEFVLANYNEGPKKNLLRKLINNPETNVFKIMCTQSAAKRELGWIFFNHPDYSLNNIDYNYLMQFFGKEDIRPKTLNALRYHISTLTLDDFKKIGMDKYIDKDSLKQFKSYVDKFLLDFIKANKISYYGIKETYKTRYIRTLQHEAFCSLWKAIAVRKGDSFISYAEVFQAVGFNYNAGLYNQFITRPKMIYESYREKIINFLSQSIIELEQKLGFLNFYRSNKNLRSILSELYALYVARSKFFELHHEIIDALLAHDKTRSGSFLYNLYKPDYENEGYSYGFYNNEAYKSFSKVSLYLGCYGTDLFIGLPIKKGGNRHHPEDSRSLALFDMVFAHRNYHGGQNTVYENISRNLKDGTSLEMKTEGFNKFQNRLRQLFDRGLKKEESDIQNGQWITEEDFKRIFPENERFSFTYNGIDYDGVSLLEMWKDIFNKELKFGEKLEIINDKITTIKDAEKNGKDPYIELLKNHAPWYYGMVYGAKRFIELLTEPSIITNVRHPQKCEWAPFTIFGYIGLDINLFKFYKSIYWI